MCHCISIFIRFSNQMLHVYVHVVLYCKKLENTEAVIRSSTCTNVHGSRPDNTMAERNKLTLPLARWSKKDQKKKVYKIYIKKLKNEQPEPHGT